MRGTVDEDIIKAQQANLINDPSDETKTKLGVILDPMMRQHEMSKKELLEMLDDKRRNLSLKESKAGRFLSRQIDDINS